MGVFENCFDPQALTSLTPDCVWRCKRNECFDPQALTSLTVRPVKSLIALLVFRSTGSYEPDRVRVSELCSLKVGFDPQALTSLTVIHSVVTSELLYVSIHRLLRA